jgi:hypothetical protein
MFMPIMEEKDEPLSIFIIYSGHGCFLFIGKRQPQRENLQHGNHCVKTKECRTLVAVLRCCQCCLL